MTRRLVWLAKPSPQGLSPRILYQLVLAHHNGEKVYRYAGKSFAPVFKNQEAEPHECIYWEYSKGKAIRKDNWKLVSWNGDWELYDMKTDKTETKNLIHEYPEIAKKLKILYKEQQIRYAQS